MVLDTPGQLLTTTHLECIMAKTNLTADRLRELLHYDPATGVFTWKIGRQGAAGAGAVAGDINKRGYRRICVDYGRYMANVLAWLYMTGEWPEHDVDHRNNVRDDNRWENLRQVTRGVNNQNQHRPHRGNKSGFLGVSPNRKGWAASINVDGVKTHLGTYPTPEAAHDAYLFAKRRMHVGNML